MPLSLRSSVTAIVVGFVVAAIMPPLFLVKDSISRTDDMASPYDVAVIVAVSIVIVDTVIAVVIAVTPPVSLVKDSVSTRLFHFRLLVVEFFGNGNDDSNDAAVTATADEEDVVPPLIERWTEHLDPNSGQFYYSNAVDGTTSWDRQDVVPPLPEGWTEHLDPDSGQFYYFNAADDTSSWDGPSLPEDVE
ncbi:hypothetical protein FRACYDRAFT_268210 [Fragilariopsis cylindrus CCMP1102]|uniref:WW domain-containing protein n=1 Tax=Fragilariopsis cylindrus CCMP1102 TaxID=635003 RepID=A0A1E7FQA7_9STRA|nr:hypothetical protein FRACYDRAFT_268210 [Fragilariopsis cylindrus CCMP1102]|eukprot:OEU20294.1 hypothetical protein FRACYDRAFT_268210 [Fragilariopsis cylindrus CCMP1102]